MKTLMTVIAVLAFALAASAEEQRQRQGNFLFNAEIPRNCVEIRRDFVQKADDFWQQPPAQRPKGLPAECVLVEVYQRRPGARLDDVNRPENQYGGLRFLGWTYMKAEDVNWLHQQKTNP